MTKSGEPNWPANIAKINIAWSLAIIAVVAGVSYRNYLKAKNPEVFAKKLPRNLTCQNCGAKVSTKSIDGILPSATVQKDAGEKK